MTALMADRRRRWSFYGGVLALLALSMGLVALRVVSVKMLPFDNKSEFQVVLDLPEGTHARDFGGARLRDRGLPRAPSPRCESTEAVRRDGRAVQLQRPGAPLLPPPRRERGRRPGQSRRQGRPPAAEPCHRRGGASGDRLHRCDGTTPAPRSRRSRRDRPCCRRSWPRCTQPNRLGQAGGGAARQVGIRVARRASSTWIGPSRPRSGNWCSGWTAIARRHGWGERGADHAGRPSGPVGRAGRPGQRGRRPRG